MKQSEKLDLLLRGLYSLKDHRGYKLMSEIVKQNELPILHQEIFTLAKRLQSDNYIDATFVMGGDCFAQINSYGIEYCEEDSYSYKGNSIITNNYNITVENSPNTNIVSQSTQVNISTNYSQQYQEIMGALNSAEIEDAKREEILECLEEIKATLDAGQKPKYSFKSLLSLTADVATLAPYIVAFGKSLGLF